MTKYHHVFRDYMVHMIRNIIKKTFVLLTYTKAKYQAL